eukprot:scaffold11605_cov49-Attheya_sp.AAC.1
MVQWSRFVVTIVNNDGRAMCLVDPERIREKENDRTKQNELITRLLVLYLDNQPSEFNKFTSVRTARTRRDASIEPILIKMNTIQQHSAQKGGQLWREISDSKKATRIPTVTTSRVDCAQPHPNL